MCIDPEWALHLYKDSFSKQTRDKSLGGCSQHAVNVANLQRLHPGRDVLPLSRAPPLPPCVQVRLHLWLNHLWRCKVSQPAGRSPVSCVKGSSRLRMPQRGHYVYTRKFVCLSVSVSASEHVSWQKAPLCRMQLIGTLEGVTLPLARTVHVHAFDNCM